MGMWIKPRVTYHVVCSLTYPFNLKRYPSAPNIWSPSRADSEEAKVIKAGETGLGTLTSARGRCRLAEPGAVTAGSELPPRQSLVAVGAERPNFGQGPYLGKEG